jgi:uncharacterized protein YuzE
VGRGRLAGAVTLRIRHDPSGALYLRLRDGKVYRTREAGDNAHVDLDTAWNVLGIEVIDAGHRWPLAKILSIYKVDEEDTEELLIGYPFHPPQVSAVIPAAGEIISR